MKALLAEGWLSVEVAKRLRVDRRSVRRSKAAARAGGAQAVRERPAAGRPPKLAANDKRRMEWRLLKGAGAAGFGTDLWTCPRVAELIEQRFRAQYHVDHVMLHDLGSIAKNTAHRAPESGEEAIRR